MEVQNCIAIGRDAQATKDNEFVLNVEFDEPGEYATFRTILSQEEFDVLSRILRRMIHESDVVACLKNQFEKTGVLQLRQISEVPNGQETD